LTCPDAGLDYFHSPDFPAQDGSQMLPAFIIEQIRRREEEERLRREAQRPRVELPVDAYRPAPDAPEEDPDAGRGVIVIEL
jgi:hypothetical protein